MIQDKKTVRMFTFQYFSELLSTQTIDSFRPRYANTHIILEEIRFVCENIEKGNLKPYYLKGLILEAIDQLDKDIVLSEKYKRKKNIILKHLSQYGNKDILYLKQCLNIELPYFRKYYINEVIEELSNYCARKNISNSVDTEQKSEEVVEDNIRRLINSFISECLYMGVSLPYLRDHCSFRQNISKTELQLRLKKIIKEKNFNVYLMLQNIEKEILSLITINFKNKNNNHNIKASDNWPIDDKYIPSALKIRPSREDDTLIIYKKKVLAKDSYGALLKFRFQLDAMVKFIHINYLNRNIRFFDKGLVYNYSQKKYNKIEYERIVRYKYEPNLKDFLTKLENYSNLSDGIKDQIHRSVYYLDTSLNEYNIINKYLNSWISIEVLFNNLNKEDTVISNNDDGGNDKSKSTIKYIYEYIPVISTIFYMRKIFKYLAKRVKNNSRNSVLVSEFVKEGEIDLDLFISFLSDKNKYDQLKKELGQYPELFNKIDYYFNVLCNPKKLLVVLTKHENTIKVHLDRLYRIRNDIIHSGEGVILKNKLFNLTSISMLTINNQEYAIEFINKVSMLIKEKKSEKEDVKLIDVLRSCKVIYDMMKYTIQDTHSDKISKEDTEKILTPTKFMH